MPIEISRWWCCRKRMLWKEGVKNLNGRVNVSCESICWYITMCKRHVHYGAHARKFLRYIIECCLMRQTIELRKRCRMNLYSFPHITSWTSYCTIQVARLLISATAELMEFMCRFDEVMCRLSISVEVQGGCVHH